MGNQCKPIAGGKIFEALKDQGCIVMAANIRIARGIAAGIFQAAKDADAALIVELAKSECDLQGGYTGFTPGLFAKTMSETAAEIGFDIWALHADHLTLKKGTEEEIEDIKRLIATQIGAGYTSFAIDASFLFDEQGKSEEQQLARNIQVTVELAKFIETQCPIQDCGLEVEVGEIGKKNAEGMVVTSPQEATTFVRELNRQGVHPQVLAVANGSTHGFIYDSKGNRIEQVSIDIQQTQAIAKALRKMASPVRIAQHGITGTPRELIATKFPKGDIIKGNVGTFWMDIAWDVLKIYEPALFDHIEEWVQSTYKQKAQEQNLHSSKQIFDKFCKYAIKQFFAELDALDENTTQALKAAAYAEALQFFEAFGAYASASKVRAALS